MSEDITITVRKQSWLEVKGEREVTDDWTTEIHCPDPADVVRYLVTEGHITPSSTEYINDLTWTSKPYLTPDTDVWNQWTVFRGDGPDRPTDDEWRAVWELMTVRQQSTKGRETMAKQLQGAEFAVRFSEDGRTVTVSGGGPAVMVERVIEEMEVRVDTHATWPEIYMGSLAEAEVYAQNNPCTVVPLDDAVPVRWCLSGGRADRFFLDLADVMHYSRVIGTHIPD